MLNRIWRFDWLSECVSCVCVCFYCTGLQLITFKTRFAACSNSIPIIVLRTWTVRMCFSTSYHRSHSSYLFEIHFRVFTDRTAVAAVVADLMRTTSAHFLPVLFDSRSDTHSDAIACSRCCSHRRFTFIKPKDTSRRLEYIA